jgi:hypothetical protein
MMRRRLLVLAPGVVAAFLVTAALPRSVYVVHHHDGDEHEHVHAFGAVAAGDGHHHHCPPPDEGADLEAPEVFPAEHAHWQHPYQWGDAVEVLPLVPYATLVTWPAPRPTVAPFVARARPVARGPPFPV